MAQTLKCPYKRPARCRFSTGSASDLLKHVKSEHSRIKMPKSNHGMAHCIWPECGYEHERPSKILAHVAEKHRD